MNRTDHALAAVESSPPAANPLASVSAAVGAAIAAATPIKRKRGRPKGSVNQPKQPKLETLSQQARTHGALILEVLAGVRSTTQAAEAMGVSPVRYYAIEARAVHALIEACAPRPAGPVPDALSAREFERLRADKTRLEQEAARLRAVLRSTQRGIGVPPVVEKPKPPTVAGKKTRKVRRPAVRALTTVRRLLKAAASTAAAADATPATAPSGG